VALRNRKNPVLNPETEDWFTLVDTGALRDSIEAEVDIEEKVFTIQAYSEIPYAREMQEGTVFQGHPVPSRPFLFLVEPDDGDAAESAIAEAVHG
jgi:hypothetical protein